MRLILARFKLYFDEISVEAYITAVTLLAREIGLRHFREREVIYRVEV